MAIGAHPEPDVADMLRRARERRGVGIADAYRATRILPVYLRALEDDAPVEQFPAPVYAVSFLREYARYLELDEEPLVQAFKDRHVLVEEPLLVEVPKTVVRGPSGWAARALIAVSVVALVAVAVDAIASWGSSSNGGAPGGAPRPVSSGALPVAGPPGDADPRPPAAPLAVTGIHAVVLVREPSWVGVVRDGRSGVQRTVAAGRTLRIDADHSLTLVLGNPAGVRLEVNGERVSLADQGSVAHVSFVWRRGRLGRS